MKKQEKIEKLKGVEVLSEQIGMDLAEHIEKFACAFYKEVDCDPRKTVMIHETHFKDGQMRSVYWFERKRGRSRKEILKNLQH
jgi:hypothetical protein